MAASEEGSVFCGVEEEPGKNNTDDAAGIAEAKAAIINVTSDAYRLSK